ncbi:MAG TPA: NAD(P)-binding protein [Solirubrobacterales bacterium]|nr:NAD(P)-binding protein [Solirubrobacterales bacterium]
MGAGLSGVAMARALAARGIPFDCFERRREVGGVCASPAPPRLDVSKERLQFSDWPMPATYPRLPSGRHLAAYLRDYCGRFELGPRIQLGTEVRWAGRRPEVGWELELDSGERRAYSTLLIAAGRRGGSHSRAVPGGFAGEQREGWPPSRREELAGRDVVIAGGGAEACELATEASYAARSTVLAVRRPRFLLPQIALGRPLDAVPGLDHLRGRALGRGRLSFSLPRRLRGRLLRSLHAAVSSPALHGLPAVPGAPTEAGAAAAPQLLERLLHGRVEIRPAIARLDGELVHFSDGSAARAELIVWTGSRPRFPFLHLGPADTADPLLSVFAAPDLAFLGLVEPVAGSPTAVAELQAGWVAAGLAGDYALPSRRGGGPVRPAPRLRPVEQFEYARDVEREMRAGRRRARSRAA